MNKMLCVQIPYTQERELQVKCLLDEFNRQIKEYGLAEYVELMIDGTGKEMSIGEKRQSLYQKSNGIYTVQWDSDDWISEDGLPDIIIALKQNPDCVTYQEWVDIDGKISRSNFSLQYEDWKGDGNSDLGDGFSYWRTPFFKTPIKTEICLAAGVHDLRFGEDHDFARRIKPLLSTEIHIPKFIYHYIHRSTPFNERYGIV